MGKKLPPSQKYGAPLYAAAWPSANLVFVAGGGGKKSSGMKNRLVALRYEDGSVAEEEVAALQLDNCPMRMVALPGGKALILALAGGGLLQIRVDPGEGGSPPTLTALTEGDIAERLRNVGEVKCIAASSDGRLLGVGTGDGALAVLEVPSMRTKAEIKGEEALPGGVRDLDFSPGHQQQMLVSTCEDGSCALWQWEKAHRLTSLQCPPELKRGSFGRCRFSRDGSLGLYTAVNAEGVGHLLHWQQDEEGELVLRKRAKLGNAAITALEISSDGSLLGLGTLEGDAIAVDPAWLTVSKRVGSAHMVFVTAVSVAPDGGAFLSVSADASARCTAVRKRGAGGGGAQLPGAFRLSFLMLLLAIVLYYAACALGYLGPEWSPAKLLRGLKDPYDFPGAPEEGSCVPQ